MFKTSDGGDEWVEVNSSLTQKKVRTLAVGPLTPETLYADTTGGGVFVTAHTVFIPLIKK